MIKEAILQEFSDINQVYNNCTKYDTLKRMLDELDYETDATRNGILLDKIKEEIERLHYDPILDFVTNDKIIEMVLDIIDNYKTESEEIVD